MPRYDTAVLNGTVVIPYVGAARCDVGIRAGRIAALADSIASADADTVIDARDRLVLPGAVDSHFHIGIYRDLATDARSETTSALAGGVTTVLSYFRTGQHYLNKSGPYRTIFPEVVAATIGQAYTDFGYHIGVMTTEQLDEVDWLVGEQGVASFKYYMFYKGLNLLMRQVAAAGLRYGEAGRVSLSLHCEQAELIRVFIEEVKRAGPPGLEGYHRSRPPLTEQLSIAEALVLTDAHRVARGSLLGAGLHAVRRNAGARLADAYPLEGTDGVSGRNRTRAATGAVRQAPGRAPQRSGVSRLWLDRARAAPGPTPRPMRGVAVGRPCGTRSSRA
jgi:allantoinase